VIRKIFLLFTMILAASLSACGTEATLEAQPIPTHDSSYPPPAATREVSNALDMESYPAPATAVAQPAATGRPVEIPKPGEDAGVVTGKLLTPDENGEPYLATIYLARTVEADQEGFPPLIAFSEETDPKAVQDSSGQFVVAEVPPGTYALIIWTPVTSIVIEETEGEDYLLFEVKAGEVTDLGIIPIG
jgi:hypothetical protein